MSAAMHRTGAVFFLLWGLLHVLGGAMILVAEPSAQLAMFGSAVVDPSAAVNPGPVASGVMSFHAFNLLWMGLLVSVIAIRMNWHNSRAGFWINFAIVSAADVGLIAFLILPGHMAVSDGLPGPSLWLLASVFAGLGLLGKTGGRVPE